MCQGLEQLVCAEGFQAHSISSSLSSALHLLLAIYSWISSWQLVPCSCASVHLDWLS